MAFSVVEITDPIAENIAAWCGVSDPTPEQWELFGLAADAAVSTIKRYAGLDDDDVLPLRYEPLAVEIGAYLYEKRGVDGTLAFAENGVRRSFEAGSIPRSMLARITLPVKAG